MLNNLVAWAVTQGVILLKSDGSPWRPIVHIEDISRAFIAGLGAPREKVHNEAFNVGQTDAQLPHPRDRRGRRRGGARAAGWSSPPTPGPDKRSYRVSFDKIARVLPDFKPQWDARAGAEQLYAAYTSSKLTLEEFEGPRFQRISHIRQLLADGLLGSDLRFRRIVEEAPALVPLAS